MRTWKIGFAFSVAMVLTVGLLTSLAQSQEKKSEGAPGAAMPSQEEMQAMMEAMGKVGPEHKMLKEQFAGNWKADVTFYWGPTPEKSTGTMTSEMILGGRYVHGMYKGTAMGQPFEGAGLTGYDNIKKKYFNTWVDSMSTGVMNLEGDYDSSSKTYTFSGETTGPDGKPCTMREVVKIDSNDKHTFTMYGPGMDGKEMKVMEIVYTRQR